jgi:hypothetical protein
MDIQLKRRINSYKFTEDIIHNIIANNLPSKKLQEKFKDFTSNNNNDLVYNPTGQIVASPNDREKIVNNIYNEFGLGSGMNNLYEKVSRRYLNITRVFIRDFLKRQSTYQLSTSQPKQVNKKIYSNGINKTFYVDLIDMNPLVKYNKGHRYILTGVDAFSKFVFLVKLKNKDAKTLVTGLREICMLQASGFPKCIVSDNGAELKNIFVKEFCDENGIKQVFGRSYSPKSNALCEATNGIIRHVLRSLFIHNGNNNWCDHLEEVRKAINDSCVESTGRPRSEVYQDLKYHNEILQQAINQNKQVIQKNETEKLNIGDKVRISLLATDSKIRENYKSGNQKNVIVRYSIDLFEIVKIIKSRSKFARDKYLVKNIKTNEILNQSFYSNELRNFPNNTIINKNLTKSMVNKLNLIKTNVRPEKNIIQLRPRNNNFEDLYWREEDND